MPRRDGLPTNPEMLLRFNDVAHRVYTTAYERLLEGRVPDELRDKPLRYLTADIYRVTLDSSLPVRKESLTVGLLDESDAFELTINDIYGRYSDEELQRYVDATQEAGGLVLDDSLRLSHLAVQAMTATYKLHYREGRAREVSSYSERPAKQVIASAIYCAEDVERYLESEAIYLPAASKVKQRMAAIAMGNGFGAPPVTMHRWQLAITPNVPLSGHETRTYLEQYTKAMFVAMMESANRLERWRSSRDNSFLVEMYEHMYDKYRGAYQRAQAFLDVKY